HSPLNNNFYKSTEVNQLCSLLFLIPESLFLPYKINAALPGNFALYYLNTSEKLNSNDTSHHKNSS
ncbi:hypothetical protein AB4486_28720, partial [Vibrio sp. 10N.222.55.C6]|uniref:hypothetical protein n=1 Tax=Vibrio sp. 10N.222.55.C6 TaxID=3229649 RepID=UPI0035521C0F